jgi:hypothetical protein
VNSAFAKADAQGEVTLTLVVIRHNPTIWRFTRAGMPLSGSTTRSLLISMVHGTGLSWSSNKPAGLINAELVKASVQLS